MIKTLKLRSHWVRKMVGLQSLQITRKFNKIMTVILMINKDGLHPLITIKKWQKLTLLMLRKKLNYQNQHKIKYSKVNKICNKLSNKKNSKFHWSVLTLQSKTYPLTWESNSYPLMAEPFLQSEDLFGNVTSVGNITMSYKIKSNFAQVVATIHSLKSHTQWTWKAT